MLYTKMKLASFPIMLLWAFSFPSDTSLLFLKESMYVKQERKAFEIWKERMSVRKSKKEVRENANQRRQKRKRRDKIDNCYKKYYTYLDIKVIMQLRLNKHVYICEKDFL